jgi:hypothetical protein
MGFRKPINYTAIQNRVTREHDLRTYIREACDRFRKICRVQARSRRLRRADCQLYGRRGKHIVKLITQDSVRNSRLSAPERR